MNITKHARARMIERNVSYADLHEALAGKGKPCRQRANRTVFYLPRGAKVLVAMVADGKDVTTVFWTENKRRG